MGDKTLIDYTDEAVLERQNIAPNAACDIDGAFYDIRNLVFLARVQADALAEAERKLAKAVEERDEALNQLDSARHSVEVLEKRLAELTGGKDD